MDAEEFDLDHWIEASVRIAHTSYINRKKFQHNEMSFSPPRYLYVCVIVMIWHPINDFKIALLKCPISLLFICLCRLSSVYDSPHTLTVPRSLSTIAIITRTTMVANYYFGLYWQRRKERKKEKKQKPKCHGNHRIVVCFPLFWFSVLCGSFALCVFVYFICKQIMISHCLYTRVYRFLFLSDSFPLLLSLSSFFYRRPFPIPGHFHFVSLIFAWKFV